MGTVLERLKKEMGEMYERYIPEIHIPKIEVDEGEDNYLETYYRMRDKAIIKAKCCVDVIKDVYPAVVISGDAKKSPAMMFEVAKYAKEMGLIVIAITDSLSKEPYLVRFFDEDAPFDIIECIFTNGIKEDLEKIVKIARKNKKAIIYTNYMHKMLEEDIDALNKFPKDVGVFVTSMYKLDTEKNKTEVLFADEAYFIKHNLCKNDIFVIHKLFP